MFWEAKLRKFSALKRYGMFAPLNTPLLWQSAKTGGLIFSKKDQRPGSHIICRRWTDNCWHYLQIQCSLHQIIDPWQDSFATLGRKTFDKTRKMCYWRSKWTNSNLYIDCTLRQWDQMCTYNQKTQKTQLAGSMQLSNGLNKKFELMLTRHAKAYSSSGSVV